MKKTFMIAFMSLLGMHVLNGAAAPHESGLTGKTAIDPFTEALRKAGYSGPITITEYKPRLETPMEIYGNAIKNGDVPLVQRLLAGGEVSIDTVLNDVFGDKIPTTPLILAIGYRRLPLVKFLLENGADANAPDREGLTPLMYAMDTSRAYREQPLLVKYLLEKGADINVRDAEGLTPLKNAIKNTNAEVVKTLLEYPTVASKKGAIHVAAAEEVTGEEAQFPPEILWGVIQPLVAVSLEEIVEARDRWGKTPLMYAAEKGDAQMIEMLLASHADPNAISNSGSSPLIWGERGGNPAVIKLLLAAGAKAKMNEAYKSAMNAVNAPWNRDRPEVKEIYEKIANMLSEAGATIE